MDKKIIGYILVGCVIVFGGIIIYNKNRNNSYIRGGLSPANASNYNDAVKAGMPYSLDLSKIQQVMGYAGGDDIAPTHPTGEIHYNDNTGKWRNNTLQKKNDGYYLCDMIVGGQYTWYVYDLKTGAFLRTWKDPSHSVPNGQQETVNVPTGQLTGCVWTVDDKFGENMGYCLYPNGDAVAANGMPLGNVYMEQNNGNCMKILSSNLQYEYICRENYDEQLETM